MWKKLFDRPTGEILIILVGVTVCGYVVLQGIIILALAFFTDRDLTEAARNIADIINTLIGLLAGYLAGRTDVLTKKEIQDQAKKGPVDEP
jgi:cytochrome bd-type quinol oxidase subunit 2